MRDYAYSGYYPYGPADLYCIDFYVDENFSGNVVESIISEGLGEFRIISDEYAQLLLPKAGYSINFIKEDERP